VKKRQKIEENQDSNVKKDCENIDNEVINLDEEC
jgi:hypothetical protein